MSPFNWPRLFFCALLLSASAVGSEADPLFRLKTYVPNLIPSPPVCELEAELEFCRFKASLIWEVPKAGDYCLYFVEQDTILRCWENKWTGLFEFTLYASADAHFLLIRGRNGTIAAKATMAVLGTIHQQENAKNKKGVWRIF